MKKKKIFLVCLCMILFTGCGNHAENVPAVEEGSLTGTVAEDAAATGTEENVAKKESEETESATAVKTETEAPGTPEDTGGTGTAGVAGTAGTEALGGNAAEETAQKPSFVFGDRATMNNNVNGRELPIYCVGTEEKKVALSFDAAWGNEDTAKLLAILKEHNLHVTFFMTGGWVESYPEDVKAILEAGHDLGNHSENHPNMSELSDEEKKEEIMSVHRKVKEITGYDMFLFRPPYGDYDNALIDVLKDCGYYGIQWDVDSLDWKNEGVEAILETVTEHKNLGNGSIILCHNGGEYTAEALDELICALEGQGYEIVPVSELIYPDNYHMDVQGRQIADE